MNVKRVRKMETFSKNGDNNRHHGVVLDFSSKMNLLLKTADDVVAGDRHDYC